MKYRNENNNEIKLRIYFNYLFDVNSKESELVNYDDEYVEYTLLNSNKEVLYSAFGYKKFLQKTGMSDGVLYRSKNTNKPISRGKFKGCYVYVNRQPKGRKEI